MRGRVEMALLTSGDAKPVGFRNFERASDYFIVCEHAGNRVPSALHGLGLSAEDLDRHIAIDIGILGVSKALSDALLAPLIYQRYSRLVVECNRRLSAPDLMAEEADGTIIPGNRNVSTQERNARIEEIALPFHAAVSEALGIRKRSEQRTFLISMHSFTPALKTNSEQRPWHVGLCVGNDKRFSRHVMRALEKRRDLISGWNKPYEMNMDNEYTILVHAERRVLPYVQFEIRQDLISNNSAQEAWGRRIADILDEAREAFMSCDGTD